MYAIVDEAIYPAVARWSWRLDSDGYVFRSQSINGRVFEVRLHRAVMACSPGDGLVIDHINRNPLDNRRENLRIVSAAINQQNRGYQRARPRFDRSRNKWRAKFKYNKKEYYAGSYDTEQEAQEALDKKRREVTGQ
ncbi:HNH endonuclease [Actinomadura adrarensis]|uniref:HNH endonuclease n=1 Tax=Actinomadura adrarensis TaxID=1819600 RepID=A0ABW3CIS3_9ACTN